MAPHIARQFRGPEQSGNGGYACGLAATGLPQPVEVTLHAPPPLDRHLVVTRSGTEARVHHDGDLIAAARSVGDVPAPAAAPSYGDALRAAGTFDESSYAATHPYPGCFTCGPHRREGDGLRIFAGPVDGRDVFAAPWTAPAGVAAPLVWAALDCPGAIAVGFPDRGETLLGRFAARVDRVPSDGEECVVVSWPLGEDGRKLYAGTALFSDAGEPLAVARATWIVPR